MDRPTHRRLTLLGLLLLAGITCLLLGRQWTSAPSPVRSFDNIPARQRVESPPEKVERATVEVAPLSASAPPLALATNFQGQVVDAVTRHPVKMFEVHLVRVRRETSTEEAPITRSFAAETGRFNWNGVDAGTWRAAVSAPGYQLFNLEEFEIPAGTATREFVIPLLRGFAVRGRVFELSTGAGIVDAGISFRQVGVPERFGRSQAYAKSTEDGSFTLDGVPGGNIVLTVAARDHAYRELRIVVDEKTPPQEIVLSAGGTITGTVTTIAGVPVKGVVRLEGPGPGFISQTNDSGQFSYEHLSAGRYRVSADTSAGGARQEFALGRDEFKEGIALIVGAGRTVRGTIRGLRSEQLQRTRLLLLPGPENAALSARADERGAYALIGVPAGHAVITVIAPGLQFDKTVNVPADQDVTFDILVPAGARLSGRVTQGGKPAANKIVWMRPVVGKSAIRYEARTSQDGQYEIEGLPPGEYQFRAEEDISRAITMAGDAVLNIDVPSVQLSARVVEEGSAVPIVGANVYLRGSSVETARVRRDKQTDDFGQLALTGIETGEITLIVYKPGYEMHRETIAYSAPITNRTITLRKSVGVEVRVQAASRRFPHGFTITQSVPGNDTVIDLWIPLDGERVGHVPSALAGTNFLIGRFSGTPIVFDAWDGQPFDLP